MFVGWSSKTKQTKIHKLLIEPTDYFESVLDVGCGVGDLEKYSRGRYTGIDILPEMIKAAKKHNPTKGEYHVSDITKYQVKNDWVIACGTYNLLCEDNMEYLEKMIHHMDRLSILGFMFNLTSKYAKKKEDGICYYDPGKVFNMIKYKFKKANLVHDYAQDDFAVFVKK